MATDIRIKTGFWTHPKTIKLVSRLGVDDHDWRPAICLMKLWGFAADHHPRGTLTGMTKEDIGIAAQWHGDHDDFVTTLIEIGFLDENKKFLSLHDWKEHNPYVYHQPERKTRAKHAAAARWKKCSEHADSMPDAMLNDDFSNAPLPAPLPSPIPNQNKPPQKSTATNHQRFIEHWMDIHQKVFGFKYVFKKGADGKAVKDILAAVGFDDACRYAKIYLTSKDEFADKVGRDLRKFNQALNGLRQQEAKKHKKEEVRSDGVVILKGVPH